MCLSPLEIAAGAPLPLNAEQNARPAATDPLRALREAIAPALGHPPCLVSFSGGVDSSVVLAVAADVARREGLPAPVPITWRFTDAPRAEESDWQERVIAQLGLGDWVRLMATDELDLTGPVAMATLLRHGLAWPPNAFLHMPLIERAAGGSLLTGIGGDQLTVLWHPRWRALADARARRRSPVARDALRLAAACVPRGARELRERRAHDVLPPWLAAGAARDLLRALAASRAECPPRWDDYLAWMAGRRDVVMQRDSVLRLGRDCDVHVCSPLLDAGFLAALGRCGGRDGLGGRSSALRRVLGDLWPSALDPRRTKATFDEVFWRASSRTLAKESDGAVADPALVDRAVLRQEWRAAMPDTRTALLVQQLALARAHGGAGGGDTG